MENINALLRRAALAYYNGKPMMSDEEFEDYEDEPGDEYEERQDH